MKPVFLTAAGIFGLISVILSALLTHHFSRLLDVAELADVGIAINFQLYHAIVLLALSALSFKNTSLQILSAIAGSLFIIGIILFSGSIELGILAHLNGLRVLAPIGGMSLILGWVATIVCGARWLFGTGD